MIAETPEVRRSPGAAARTPTPAVGAAGPGARAGHRAGVRGGRRHGGGEVGGALAGATVAACTGAQDAAPVYGGGRGVGPVEVPDGGGRPLTVAGQRVRGVRTVHGPGGRRVEIVLRSDVGGAGATGAARRASREGRGHSWNKWKSKLINNQNFISDSSATFFTSGYFIRILLWQSKGN